MGEDGGRAEVPASRARLGVIVAAALLLTGLTAVLVLARSSGSDDGATTAPSDCLEAWNSDQPAIDFGRHNSVAHGYSEVEVGYMPQEGSASLSADADGGECAVVFAANELDPEELAAGQIHGEGGWVPLSGLLEPTDLAELQSAAVGGANATLTSGGELIGR